MYKSYRSKSIAVMTLFGVTLLSVCSLPMYGEEANEPPIVITPLPFPPVDEQVDQAVGEEDVFMAIGGARGGNGRMFQRSGGGKKRALERFGGSKGSEAAVNAALLWFKKHQSPNGMWDVDGYPINCTEMPQCEPGTQHIDASGDVLASGYAMLCFLGSGYDHKIPSRYKMTVKKGLDWLLSVQQVDGVFGSTNEDLGVVATALAEIFALTNDQAVKGPAQKAIDLIVKRQVIDGASKFGWGWSNVVSQPERIDAATSRWCVMALRAAAASGLNVGQGLEGAEQYLKRAWDAANADFIVTDNLTEEAVFPAHWSSVTGACEADRDGHDSLATSEGALMAAFLFNGIRDPLRYSLANDALHHHMPTGFPTNLRDLYTNTMAIFHTQVGDEQWNIWNTSFRDMLITAQRKGDGCFDGSWDFANTGETEGRGRLMSTAFCCLSLEVYYHELPRSLLKE